MPDPNLSPATTASSPTPSPLAEAKPGSLTELFSRDPEDLSKQDLAAIVAELRSKRAQWVKDEASGATKARGARLAKGPKTSADANINLDDLDL